MNYKEGPNFASCSSLLESVDNHDFLAVTQNQADDPVEAYNESAFSHIEASFQSPKHQANGSMEHSPPPRQKGDKSSVSAKKKRALVLRPSRELECVLETLVGRFLGFQRDSEERFLKAQRFSQEGFLNYLRESEERFGRLAQVSEERWTRWQERWTKQERDREDARRKEDGEQHLKMMQMLGEMLINNSQEKQQANSSNSAAQSPDITITKQSATPVDCPSPVTPEVSATKEQPSLLYEEAPPILIPQPMPRFKKEPRNPLYRSSSDEELNSLPQTYYDDQPQLGQCPSSGYEPESRLHPSPDFVTQPGLSVSPGYDSHLQPDSCPSPALYSSNSAEEAEESVFHHMNGSQEVTNAPDCPRPVSITSGSEDVEVYRGKDELEREEYDRKESGFTSGSEELEHTPPPPSQSGAYLRRDPGISISKGYIPVHLNIDGSHKKLKFQISNSSASSDSMEPLRRSPIHAYPVKGAGPTTL